MPNIAPIAIPAQPATSSPVKSGTAPGSESGFESYFGQAVNQSQNNDSQTSTTPGKRKSSDPADTPPASAKIEKSDDEIVITTKPTAQPANEDTSDTDTAGALAVTLPQALLAPVAIGIAEAVRSQASQGLPAPVVLASQPLPLDAQPTQPGAQPTHFDAQPLQLGEQSTALPVTPLPFTVDQPGRAGNTLLQSTSSAVANTTDQGYQATIKAEFIQPATVIATNTSKAGILQQDLNALPQMAEQPRIVTPLTVENQSLAKSTAPEGALVSSFNQLTSLKPQGETVSLRSADHQDVPLRQQFTEGVQQVRPESQQGESTTQGRSGNQEHAANLLSTTPGQSNGTASFGESAATATHSQIAAGVQQAGQPAMTSTQTTGTTPMPYDNQLYQQVAEHFQLQMRNQQTRLQIQLHPAELGKMEIQLTVKEGAVRAQVMVQSGQVQEIIERNLGRLRSILEGQGFSVEDLQVAQQTRNEAGSMDLFHDQLAREQQDSQPRRQQTSAMFGDTLENLVTLHDSAASGINITA